jgi:hypothetical protein
MDVTTNWSISHLQGGQITLTTYAVKMQTNAQNFEITTSNFKANNA